MQPKNKFLSIATPVIAFFLICGLTSFKPVNKAATKPCEHTCQFSPVNGSFAAVSFRNCNGSASAASVAAGTNYIPILVGTGCTAARITVSLPDNHPAGTINVYQGGTLMYSHTVLANTDVLIVDNFTTTCDEYFFVTF